MLRISKSNKLICYGLKFDDKQNLRDFVREICVSTLKINNIEVMNAKPLNNLGNNKGPIIAQFKDGSVANSILKSCKFLKDAGLVFVRT